MLDNMHGSELAETSVRPPEQAPVCLAPGAPLQQWVFVEIPVIEVFLNGCHCAFIQVARAVPVSRCAPEEGLLGCPKGASQKQWSW